METAYTQQELEEIAKMLEKYPNIYVVSDEIYERILILPKQYFSISVQFQAWR